jgi:hypothetical protein
MVLIGYILHLIEPRQSILHVRGVRQRLLTLFRESVDAVRQFFAIVCIELTVFSLRFPGCLVRGAFSFFGRNGDNPSFWIFMLYFI